MGSPAVVGEGFQVTVSVPASTSATSVRVFAGVYCGIGRLTVSTDEQELYSVAYSDASGPGVPGIGVGAFEIEVPSASRDQRLNIKWMLEADSLPICGSFKGNLEFQA